MLDKQRIRIKRHARIRKKITGTSIKPRLVVFKSLNHIYAELVDDVKRVTLASASTLSKEFKGTLKNTGNIEAAKKVGELIAKKAIEAGIKEIVFDRGGYIYHGRVKAVAEASREKGLKF